MMKTNSKRTPYEMVLNENTNDKEEKPLSKVVGHDSQKEELILVLDWFKNYDYWKSKNVSVPRGVILYGDPGNGKSLLIREAIKYSGLPSFIFKGEGDNVRSGLTETFKKAKQVGHSIVVIDELDLLIDKDARVVRVLQENLDGVESSDDVMVIAATNSIDEIPDALLRNGRLEKALNVPYPTGKEAVDLLKLHFKDFGVSLPNDFNDEEIGLTMTNISCVGVKAIANETILRNGFENITTDMIIDSIYRITNSLQDKNQKSCYEIAVHEAGHAVMASKYKEFFEITRLDISQDGGKLCTREKDENYWPYSKAIAHINISLAGVLAEKVICGIGSNGCGSDLQIARESAWAMINKSGYISCSDTLPIVKAYAHVRLESEKKKDRNIKKADSLLRKCERETIRYIKKHRKEINNIADALFKKKFLKSTEVLSIISHS